MPLKHYLRYLPVVIVMAVSLAATMAFQFTLSSYHREEELVRLEALRDKLAKSIEERLDDYHAVMRGARGLIESSVHVSADEWQSYIKAIELDKTGKGFMGVAYIVRVHRDDLAEFIERQRATRPEFTVYPQSDREEIYPIVYNAPLSRNAKSIGFDVVANKTALVALRRAVHLNSVSLTEPLVLVQDELKQLGMVMYVPVYARGMPLVTAEQRDQALLGWISGPFRVADMMDTVLPAVEGKLCVELYDADHADSDERLFVNGGLPSDSAYGEHQPESITTTVSWGGRNFRLRLWTLPSFYEAGEHSLHALILGLIFTLLAGGMTWSLIFTRQRATALAEGMTEAARENEERFRSLVDNLPGAVYRCRPDDDRTLLYQSDMLREIAAWPDERPLNSMYTLVFPEDHVDVRSITRLARANKQEYHLHYRITQASGLVRWVSDYGRPVVDKTGVLVAFEGMIFDITDRKRMEQRWKCIFEQRRDLVAMLDSGGRFKMANAAFRELLDYEPVELVGKMFADIIHPRDGNDFLEEMRRLNIGMVERSLEIRVLGRDGKTHWISWTMVLDADNDQVYAYGREITHLKRESRGVRGQTPQFGALPIENGAHPAPQPQSVKPPPPQTPVGGTTVVVESPFRQKDAAPALDPYFIKPLKEMQGDDGRPLLDMLIDLYKEDTPAQIEKLGQLLRQKDFTAVKNIAHDLKGSSGNVGALPLAQCCADLDMALREGRTAGLDELHARIVAEAERVYAALEDERSTHPAGTPAS